MLISSSTGHLYPEMFAILQNLRVPLTFVSVDIIEGTMEYELIKTMQHFKHLEVIESDGIITEIASTKQGVNFYEKIGTLYFNSRSSHSDGV